MTMKISYTIRNKEIRVCLNFVEGNDYIIHARDIISFANIPPPFFFSWNQSITMGHLRRQMMEREEKERRKDSVQRIWNLRSILRFPRLWECNPALG